jgi:hypothetical protein
MKTLALIAALLLTIPAFASTRDNDDTCDIKIGPAATLLLPYFEVDVSGNSGQSTIFTVTNVSRYPQIARVTLWTDYAYPVLTFNLYLTGYDVQAINIADVLKPGIVASATGTTSATTPGPLSSSTSPNLITSLNCTNNPGTIPASIISAVRSALTTGHFAPEGSNACNGVGSLHTNAIGYATIDVVSNCTPRSPADPLYYSSDILFDNVLIGDYQQLGPHPQGAVAGTFDGAGNPMVHIRAVPEGGSAGSNVPTGLPYTFYDRYTPATARALDRRQPLPATFAARYIQGGPGAFATNITIWREGFTGAGASCAAYAANYMAFGEIIRFDERENAFTLTCFGYFGCPSYPSLPATSSSNTTSGALPPLGGNDVGGWLYINASNCGTIQYSVTRDVGGQPAPTNRPSNLSPAGATTLYGPRPSQNWVTVSMFGKLGTRALAAEFDAPPLGNGCSPAAFLSAMRPIGPAGGVFVCPPGLTLTNGTLTQCTGTNVNPLP